MGWEVLQGNVIWVQNRHGSKWPLCPTVFSMLYFLTEYLSIPLILGLKPNHAEPLSRLNQYLYQRGHIHIVDYKNVCIYRYLRWFKAMNLHGATQCHVCSAFASMVRCIILYSGYHQMHSEWGSEWLQTIFGWNLELMKHFWQQGDHTPWAHRWFIEALEDSSSGSPYELNHEWPSWRIFFRMLKPSTNERISGTANWVETIRTRRPARRVPTRAGARRVPTRAGARRVQHARAWYMCHWNLFSTSFKVDILI
jgi:hypothetical protein